MQRITREDLRKYAERYITGKPFIAGMIINEEMNKQLNPADYFKN
jgi:hypothetical protein